MLKTSICIVLLITLIKNQENETTEPMESSTPTKPDQTVRITKENPYFKISPPMSVSGNLIRSKSKLVCKW